MFNLRNSKTIVSLLIIVLSILSIAFPTTVWPQDSLPPGRISLSYIAASNAPPIEKIQADYVCTGTNDNLVISNEINDLVNAGYNSITLHLSLGTFYFNNCVTIPFGINLYVEGEGVPNVGYSFNNSQSTPTTGTQIRGPTSWNTAGIAQSLFVRAAGTTLARGQTSFKDLSLMPAWGKITGNVKITGITDLWAAQVDIDNVMFLPWGWYEAGRPSPSNVSNQFQFFNLSPNYQGGGSDCTVGTVYVFGQGYQSTIISYDNVRINRLMLYYCYNGVALGGAWANIVDEIAAYGCNGWLVAFFSPAGNRIGQIGHESLKVEPAVNYLVALSQTSRCTVDRVLVWPQPYSSTITQITNIDQGLENSCLAFNVGNSGIWQTFPRSVVLFNPFGDTIGTPFASGSTNTIGISNLNELARGQTEGGLTRFGRKALMEMNSLGTSATPTSGKTYTCNIPVDVTISGGTGVSITTKDAQGNTIDNGVSSLTHRFLLGGVDSSVGRANGYTITITYITAPTVTVIQATMGLSGSTAIPQANVNYIAYGIGVDISFSGGTGVTAKVTDGSTNTGGATLDSGLTSMTQYHLSPGQVLNFGNFSTAPTSLVVRRHNEP